MALASGLGLLLESLLQPDQLLMKYHPRPLGALYPVYERGEAYLAARRGV